MDIKVIAKARQTVIEMFEDRGFQVPLDQQNISRENLNIMLDNNNINIYVNKLGEPTKVVEAEVEAETESDIEGEIEDAAEVVEEDEAEVKDAEEAEAEAEPETEEKTEPEAELEPEVEVELNTQKGGAHSKDAYAYFHVAAGKFDKKRLVATVTKIKETYRSNDINIIIIVKEITSPVLKEVDSETYRNVEVFFYKELQSNKSKNRLVPRHELITEEEVAEVAEKYSLTPKQFFDQSPIIFTTDPMARYYGLQDGDMCRIYRKSKINGNSICYRAVIRPVMS